MCELCINALLSVSLWNNRLLLHSISSPFCLQYGLYSAFMGCFVYMFLGTAKDITLGPTAIMSLLTNTFAASTVENDPTMAIVLTLFCGLIQLAMGLLNLGWCLIVSCDCFILLASPLELSAAACNKINSHFYFPACVTCNFLKNRKTIFCRHCN